MRLRLRIGAGVVICELQKKPFLVQGCSEFVAEVNICSRLLLCLCLQCHLNCLSFGCDIYGPWVHTYDLLHAGFGPFDAIWSHNLVNERQQEVLEGTVLATRYGMVECCSSIESNKLGEVGAELTPPFWVFGHSSSLFA